MPKREPKLIVTHAANFHVDDVFATAAAVLLFEKSGLKKSEIKIKRSLDPQVWKKADVLLDIGAVYNPSKNRFDHHQGIPTKDSAHANGIAYASFGLFWKKYGKKICGSAKVAERVEEKLVVPIDAGDNGIDVYKPIIEGVLPFDIKEIVEIECAASRFVGDGKIPVDDNKNFDRGFMNLLPIAKHLIECSILAAKSHVAVEKIAMKYFEEAPDKRVIILPKFLGYGFAKMKEPLVTIYPDARGKWSAKVVRVTPSQYASRIYFPKSWAGLSNDEMALVSGVPDAVFCHKGLFLAVAKSREGAIELVNKMFKEAGFLPVKV